nr:putative short-chain dehydrogenase/reductase [uncultured bacterium]
MTGDLTGKVIVVTGGAQGIGGAGARLCAQRGATVVIADYNATGGQATADALTAAGHAARFVQVDVRSPDSVAALMGAVRTAYGRLDVLVLAAGVLLGAFTPPDEMEVETFDKVIDVNVRGVFLCTKYAMPLFDAAGGGVVIMIGSGAGVTGPSGSIAYGASKGGVNGYGMTLARHIANRNVRVNVLSPGGIATELKLDAVAQQAVREGRDPEAAKAEMKAQLGDPDGVGRVIAFLASDDAAYVRGTMYTR